MRTRTVGSSGPRRLGRRRRLQQLRLALDVAEIRAVVNAAIDAGITLFDTADTYGDGESEWLLGRALTGRRDQVVIATKFGWGKGRDDDETARGAPTTSGGDRRIARAGWAPTTSTSTSTTAPTA